MEDADVLPGPYDNVEKVESSVAIIEAPRKYVSTWSKPYQHELNLSTAPEDSKPLLIPGKHGLKELKVRKSKRHRSNSKSATGASKNELVEVSATDKLLTTHTEHSDETVPIVTQTLTFLMEDVLVYQAELARKQAILPCSNDYRVFVVGGFDFNLKCINVKQTFFIKIIPKVFTDCSHLVYTCSCKGDDLDLVTLTSEVTINTYDEFLSHIDYCIHVKAAEPLINKFLNDRGVLAENFIEQELEVDLNLVLEVPFCQGVCVIAESKSFGIVAMMNGKITCMNCRFGKTTCKHTAALRLMAESNEVCGNMVEEEEYAVLQPGIPYSRKPVSALKIKYALTDHQKVLCKDGIHLKEDKFVPLSPSPCCVAAEATCVFKDLPLFLPTKIAKISAPFVTCTCGEFIKYDGRDDGILNMGTYCVSHFIYRRFLREFQLGRNSLYSSYMIYTALLEDSGYTEARKELSYQKYRSGWHHFLYLLDIDYDSGFSCDVCLAQPEVILCDGTTVSFRRKFLDWEVFLREETETKTEPVRGRFQERVFISNSKTRKLLDLFGNSTKSSPMVSTQYLDLKNGIRNTPELFDFVTSVTVLDKETGAVYCKTVYKNVVGVLAKDSPICATIFPTDDCINALKSAIDGVKIQDDVKLMKILSEHAPLLAEFLNLSSEGNFPIFMRPLIRILISYSLKPFETQYVSHRLQQPLTDLDANLEKVTHFPSLQLLCGRQNYAADKNTRKNPSACNKTFSGHPILLPGVFTLYCGHGVCYGFQVMPSCECVDVPFTILTTRFAQMPSAVIYDHACALHKYCLNREPMLFKNTKFLIDRLHWKNHTGCSVGYCLDKYNKYKSINSQINEQINASLQRIKNSLSYMTQENFMRHCKLYLWLVNESKK